MKLLICENMPALAYLSVLCICVFISAKPAPAVDDYPGLFIGHVPDVTLRVSVIDSLISSPLVRGSVTQCQEFASLHFARISLSFCSITYFRFHVRYYFLCVFLKEL